MEAVGTEVMVVFFLPALALTVIAIIYYRQFIQSIQRLFGLNARIQQNQQERLNRLNGAQSEACVFCQSRPKLFEVSTTCGHSFCGQCIVLMIGDEGTKIKCPICNEQITTLFKIFNNVQPAIISQEIVKKLKKYNSQSVDNRPLLRRFLELPYTIGRVITSVLSIGFILFFISSAFIIRSFFISLLYLIFPFDLIPETFGFIGYIDDLFFIIVISGFFVVSAALQYRRQRGLI